MAPKKIVSKLTADVFEERYGCLVRAEFPELRAAFLLRKALAARTPAVDVTVAVLKVWFLRTGIKSRNFVFHAPDIPRSENPRMTGPFMPQTFLDLNNQKWLGHLPVARYVNLETNGAIHAPRVSRSEKLGTTGAINAPADPRSEK